MRARGLVLLSLCAAELLAADAPDSIVGVWRLDAMRPIGPALEKARNTHPGASGAERSALEASLKDVDVRMTITEDTITANGESTETTTLRYLVIGGNAGLVVIEIIDDAGRRRIANIRLIEGGIAIESTDCATYPDQCERERRAAPAHDDEHLVESNPIRAIEESAPAMESVIAPDVAYFTRVAE